MIWLFFGCVALVAYAYFGYPALLWIQKQVATRPVRKAEFLPSVSIVMAVHNCASALSSKLENLRNLNYPPELLEICIASDGSTDDTDALLESLTGRLKFVRCERIGKSAALNHALALCTGQLVFFTDVRQQIEPIALRELAANFSDDSIGCVSGELMFRSRSDSAGQGVSLYWRIEKIIRKLESATGSVVGATGAIYAVRRQLVPSLPAGTLLDDVYIPLCVQRAGKRVIFEASARAWDDVAETAGHEFRRKVRTLAGNYQLLQLAPWTLISAVSFRFLSHKISRLLVPWALLTLLMISVGLSNVPLFQWFLVLQVFGYLYAIAALFLRTFQRLPFANAGAAFLVLNAAAACALFSFLQYRNQPTRLWAMAKPTTSESVRKDAQKAG